MIMGRMACLALVCLALGVSGETPQGPWESLNPTSQPVTPTPQPVTPTPQPVTPTKQHVKHVFDQGQAIAQLAMTLEEEILVEMLPFKAPFKMDNKQMAGVIRLLKKAVKPVLKSERLRTMVSIADDYIQELENNKENKNYFIGLLNIAQDVYGEVMRMYNSEEAQGRTFETVTSIYRQSVLSNYIVEPFTNWIISPITSRITYAAERVYDMLPSNTWVVDTEYINPFTSWGETFDYYVNQIAGWSARSRNALEATARLLEHQDEGRACAGCGNSVAWGSAGGSPGTDLVE